MAANNTIMFSRSHSSWRAVCRVAARSDGAAAGGACARAGSPRPAGRSAKGETQCRGDPARARAARRAAAPAGAAPCAAAAPASGTKGSADRNTAEDYRAATGRSPYHWRLRWSGGRAAPPDIGAPTRATVGPPRQRAHKHRLTTRKETVLQNKEGIG